MLQFLFTKTPLLYLVQSFWRDEAYSYLLSQKSLTEITVLTARDFNPPLYYYILHFALPLTGKNEVLLRLISFLPYVAMVYVAYMCIRSFCTKDTLSRIFYLVFFAGVPIFVLYAFEARMYSLFAFLTLLSSYSFLTKKPKLYVVATVAGLYTHYFMLLVLFIQLLFLFVTRKKKPLLTDFKYPLLALFFFVPWIVFMLTQKNPADESFWIPPPILRDVETLFGNLYTGYERNFSYFNDRIRKVSVFLMTICTAGFFILKKNPLKKDQPFLYFGMLTVVPMIIILALSYIKPLLLPRYLIVSSVGLVFLLILISDRLPRFYRLTLITILFLISVQYQRVEVQYRTKAHYDKVIAEIKKLAHSKDFLYVTNELDYFPAQFYFDADKTYIYNKPYETIPNYVGKVLIPKNKVVSRLPIYPQKAFIMSWDLSYRIESLY